MKTIRIFISSPSDVHEEREKARRVVITLQRKFEDRLLLELVTWEDMALSAAASFQEEIDDKLGSIDIAIFVFWWRLGTPLTKVITRSNGTPYRSGTEHEFDLMLARVEENRRNQREGPEILVYFREDEKGINAEFSRVGWEEREDMVQQQKLLASFRKENFQDAQGYNARSYSRFQRPVEFADQLYKHLHDLLDQLDLEGTPAWQEAPYRGLAVFDVHHAPIFRGREQEIYDVHQRRRARAEEGCAFVCIVGASGSGKSSLARAGLAAKLMYRSFEDAVKEWRFALLYPGGKENLFAALVDCLVASPETEDEGSRLPDPLPALAVEQRPQRLQRYLEDGNAEAAGELLERVLEEEEKDVNGKISVLLVLDQMEELWSDKRISPEPFLRAMEILACRPGIFAVLATLRSDFYHHAQESPAFLRLKGERGHFDLTRPGETALREMIEKPARTAGLSFETIDPSPGGSLSERILRDAMADPGALPLLQYALGELHRRCLEEALKEGAREDGTSVQRSSRRLLLKNSVYTKIGGVEGAITQRASEVFAGLAVETQAALPELLPLLVSVEPGDGEESLAVRLRPRLADVTGADPNSPRALLTQALVAARFLTTDHDKGVATVTLTHEALLKRWPRISEWIQHNRECLRIRSQVAQAHTHWKTTGCNASLLLPRGPALVEGRHLLRPLPGILYGGIFAFVAGLLCVLMIALIFTPQALLQIGWTDSPSVTKGLLLYGLFVTNRCGYAFPVTCVGLGVAMAMMTNSLRASTVWPEFLEQQGAVTSLTQAIRVTRGIVKLSLPYAWPIVVVTPLFAMIGLAIMQGADSKAWHLTADSASEIFLGGMDATETIRAWKESLEGRMLGLFGDVLSKIVGGYFAIVGMGLGIVMLRHGVRVDPQRTQR